MNIKKKISRKEENLPDFLYPSIKVEPEVPVFQINLPPFKVVEETQSINSQSKIPEKIQERTDY